MEFEIITNTDIRNNVSNFSVKIPFEEANSRCVVCEGSITGTYVQKENKIFNVFFESKIQLWNKLEFQWFYEKLDRATPFPLILKKKKKWRYIKHLKSREAVTNEDLCCLMIEKTKTKQKNFFFKWYHRFLIEVKFSLSLYRLQLSIRFYMLFGVKLSGFWILTWPLILWHLRS